MSLLKSLARQFSLKPIDWDELEESLIRADLGVPMTLRIVTALRDRAAWTTITAAEIVQVAREEILRILPSAPALIQPIPGKPKVIVVVGVNGTGKTTSVAKLAHYLQQDRQWSRREPSDMDGKAREGSQAGRHVNHTVLLAAADTFRAAAIEQLGIWAERLGVEMIRGQYNADPASLCYEAYQAAEKRKIEFLICDTAGRLHTKSNLMAELSKVKRSIAKHDATAPHEILLVIDATTGSNALAQATEFHQAVGLTGLIVTKLDGSGKGGIVVAIQEELGIPTRFVGTGEKLEDFAPFNCAAYIDNLL